MADMLAFPSVELHGDLHTAFFAMLLFDGFSRHPAR